MFELPAYFPYKFGGNKPRLLVGKTCYEYEEGNVLLHIWFEEEVWLLDEGPVPVSLVYGDRAERVKIGEADFQQHGSNTELVIELETDSEAVRMLPMTRSFAIGY